MMSENHVMLMAQFIHGHPELQMLPPRVWKTHYKDECQAENKIYSFSVLKQYSSLVRIQKVGRNNLYGSAKIPAAVKIMPTQSEVFPRSATSLGTSTLSSSCQTEASCQLELDYIGESALKEIHQIMLSASNKIQQVVRKAQTSSISHKNE